MKTAADAPKDLTPEQAERWAAGWNAAASTCPNPKCAGEQALANRSPVH